MALYREKAAQEEMKYIVENQSWSTKLDPKEEKQRNWQM